MKFMPINIILFRVHLRMKFQSDHDFIAKA